MDYTRFDLADFLTDDRFLRWVYRPNADSDRFWSEFLAANPQQATTVQKAREMALDLEQTEHEPYAEDGDTLKKMWSHIEENTISAPPVQRPTKRVAFAWYAAAASVVLLLGTWLWLGKTAGTSRDVPAVMQEISSSQGVPEKFITRKGPRLLTLPDSSRVQISANSTLRFPKVFAPGKREVYLIGECFFEVTRRPEQPFLVHTDDLVTRVLGTSFRVKAYEDERDVSVDVRTGKVAVYVREYEDAHDAEKVVTLTPNQKVVYEVLRERLRKEITDNPVPLKQAATLQFDETPIADIFQAIEQEYGIPIQFDRTRLGQCTLTTSIEGLPLFGQLELICKAVGATFVQQDGGILVKDGGCR